VFVDDLGSDDFDEDDWGFCTPFSAFFCPPRRRDAATPRRRGVDGSGEIRTVAVEPVNESDDALPPVNALAAIRRRHSGQSAATGSRSLTRGLG